MEKMFTFAQPKLLAHFSLMSAILFSTSTQADILPESKLVIKIPLAQKSASRPMSIAYSPVTKHYYVADGGLAPMASEFEAAVSKSPVHAYTEEGKYVNSAKPGYDSRSIYFNTNTNRLETVTYNVSSDVGFTPNTGIYALETEATGQIKDSSTDVSQFNPAFGDSGTAPSYDAQHKVYYAKQERSPKVLIVDPTKREKIGELALDLSKANVAFDDISDHFIGYSGIAGQELIALDVDHKAILVFDLTGKFVGKSELPKDLKLRSQNHFNGIGYTNGLMFVYHENEGEFGTFHGYQAVK